MEAQYHSPERRWLILVSSFLANAAAHLQRNALSRTTTGGMDTGDWLAYRLLLANSELVNVEALFHQ